MGERDAQSGQDSAKSSDVNQSQGEAAGDQSEEAGEKPRKAGGRKGNRGKRKNQPPQVVEVPPAAGPARMRRRHWGILVSFLVVVIVPVILSAFYLWGRAVDQYGSTVGFTVRQEDGNGASDILGGLAAQVGGTGGTSDTDIVYEFIQSQSLVGAIDEEFDLVSEYSRHYDTDPIFALAPDASLEDLVDYWQRIVRVSYDQNSRLIELRVLAFDPETAQSIARAILERSQALINDLNRQARNDMIRYAERDLAEAQERLRKARAELIRFRTTTQLVDPESDLQGRMGVVNMLQSQLAEALIDLDMLHQSTNQNDPRVTQARRRIEVIRDRIAQERRNVALGETGAEGEQGDYPTILAEYEALLVDREFAEESYTAALAALDSARAEAARQSRYLVPYIDPTLPQTSEFPQRWTLLGLVALFLTLSWAILALVYYSIRDSR